MLREVERGRTGARASVRDAPDSIAVRMAVAVLLEKLLANGLAVVSVRRQALIR